MNKNRLEVPVFVLCAAGQNRTDGIFLFREALYH